MPQNLADSTWLSLRAIRNEAHRHVSAGRERYLKRHSSGSK